MVLLRPFRFSRLLFTCMLSLILLASCGNPPAQAQATSLEAQVLDIIRKYPEVILESVQAYQRRQQQAQQQAQQAFVQQLQNQPAAVIGDSPVRGAEDRTIVLLEFSDFQCPFCAQAYTVVEAFMDKHEDEVTLVYKHFPLTQIHPQAQPAALAAWAAQQQGQYWPYYQGLFENQAQLGEPLYGQLAEELGLDLEQFDRDRTSSTALNAIAKDVKLGGQAGIRGTPSLFLNGIPLQLPLTVEGMEAVLAELK